MTDVGSGFGPSPFRGALVRALAEHWWLILLRGIVSIGFGILAFVWPVATLLSIALIWGAFVAADGAMAVWAGLTGRAGESGRRWWLTLAGLAGIAAGILAMLYPGLTALFLLLLIAGWAMISGLLQIAGAIALRREIEGEWFLILNGLLSAAVGIAVFAMPGAGALALVWLVAAYAVIAGSLYIPLALRLKKLGDRFRTE